MEDIDRKIRQLRSSQVRLEIKDSSGESIPNASVHVRMTNHQFRFGANAFRLFSLPDEHLQAEYDRQFAELNNYATLPFYWGSYEREEGKTSSERLRRMAEWCRSHGIAAKGHPLAWHEVFPAWANRYDDDFVLRLLRQRVERIVSEFASLVDTWDVINEATVSHRFDNAIGRWIRDNGVANCVAEVFGWARESNKNAELLYNDFNISPAYEELIAELLDRGVQIDALGIQSHMHKGEWPIERVIQTCDRYAKFGLPLHWTEVTVLSGRLKAPDDNDWHKPHRDWHSTPEGEAKQAEYVSLFYKTLYAHPAVEAITWWDFSDNGAWQGAPAGFLRRDMSPKPVYERLKKLIKGDWWTDETAISSEKGIVNVTCFYGSHELSVTTESGRRLSGNFTIRRGDDTNISVTVE